MKLKILIDLGTTNVEFRMIASPYPSLISSVIVSNPQRKYGKDVISRIKAANDGMLTELSTLIRQVIMEQIIQLQEYFFDNFESDRSIDSIDEVFIAGNPTMIHILMGYDCKTLGEYPYHSSHLDTMHTNLKELGFVNNRIIHPTASVHVVAGLTGFVGGDIVSGILSIDMACSPEISILMDLGTNGEIVMGNRKKILVASTAIGSAFDGYQGKYGSEIIAEIDQLLQDGKMDQTGYVLGSDLDPKKRGLQHEIRDIQLAKAALRAGLEILIRAYGTTWEGISRIYIAGNFGNYIDIKAAIRIGLLPDIPCETYQIIGNSCLHGLQDLAELHHWHRIEDIKTNTNEVVLANESDFQELYMKYLYFPQ